ncbi:KICSTOR complex protein kaptin-like [Gigantopelta aegis]|uniref:KICSTOR complex protein kaptin-like n=1 Tax=Gigantopelta aegis TaxID=1735272 RepID=UPI001B888C7B|nr:KICSTOR complex protein kaptin-like [Gigantopelta aegis]
MEDRWKWTDAHFCSLSSQTNVYGLTKVTGNEGTNKVLVAPLDGRVISIEYTQRDKRLTPCTKCIQFTYIPGDAEIVSVDVISNCLNRHGIVVGITFFKLQENESKPASQFLNLYSSCQSGEEANLDVVAQGCQSLELSFIPYQLIHTNLILEKTEETVFLLSGGDNKMHLYREVSENHKFEEVPSDEYFPEFSNITQSVLVTTILNLDGNQKRLTAMGHQDGLVKLSLVDAVKREILQTWSTEHDSPITCLKLFTPETQVPCPPFIESTRVEENGSYKSRLKDKTYNLVVISALDTAVVYRNMMQSGFTDPLPLPGSDQFDCPMCACIVDIDFDGEHEILIGTYGQELLAYKYVSKKHVPPEKPADFVEPASDVIDPLNTPVLKNDIQLEEIPSQTRRNLDCVVTGSTPDSADGHHDDVDRSTGFHLLWQRSFPCPVMGIDSLDITGDGIEELIVVTLKGLHILQPDLNEVSELLLERLRSLTDTGSDADDAYRILQTETFGK